MQVEAPDEGLTWLQTFHRKVLKLYACILRDEPKYLTAIAKLPFMVDVEPTQLTIGSILLKVKCLSPAGYENLVKGWRGGEIGASISNILISQDVLDEVGVESIVFEAVVDESQLATCKEYFMNDLDIQSCQSGSSLGSSDSGSSQGNASSGGSGILLGKKLVPRNTSKPQPERTNAHTRRVSGPTSYQQRQKKTGVAPKTKISVSETSQLRARTDSRRASHDGPVSKQSKVVKPRTCFASEFWSRTDCACKVSELTESLNLHIDSIRDRYETFKESLEEFLMALKLSKPRDLECYQNLSHVITCHNFLNESPSVGKSVRTDLVTKYLKMINVIRIHITTVSDSMKELAGHVIKYVTLADKSVYISAVQEVETLLEPDTDFLSLVQVNDVHLGIMDKKLFTGLVRYIPALLSKLAGVTSSLDHILKKLDFDRECADHESDQHNVTDTGKDPTQAEAVDHLVDRINVEKAMNIYDEVQETGKFTEDAFIDQCQTQADQVSSSASGDSQKEQTPSVHSEDDA